MAKAAKNRSALPIGAKLYKNHVIDDVLGSGGFGITYKIRHPKRNKAYAVKEFYIREASTRDGETVAIHSDIDRKKYDFALEKFRNEAKLLKQLDHPNIVNIHDTFDANGTSYIVLDFIDGRPFGSWLKARRKPPDEPTLRKIFAPLLDAVGYMHDQDLMHRDLSPSNIMVTRDLSPVLIDFGTLGKGLGEVRPDSSRPIAHESYAPFEQMGLGEKQGAFTDIYTLGAVLYEAVTGAPPMASNSRIREAGKRDSDDPYVPVGQAAKAPELYSTMFFHGLDMALRMEPEDRPQTIAQFRDELGWGSKPTVFVEPETPVISPMPGRASEIDEQTGSPPARRGKAGLVWGTLAAVLALVLIGGAMAYSGVIPDIIDRLGGKSTPAQTAQRPPTPAPAPASPPTDRPTPFRPMPAPSPPSNDGKDGADQNATPAPPRAGGGPADRPGADTATRTPRDGDASAAPPDPPAPQPTPQPSPQPTPPEITVPVTPPPPAPPARRDRLALYNGLDFFGDDLNPSRPGIEMPNAVSCARACLTRRGICRAFTFNTKTRQGRNCFLKTGTGTLDRNNVAISGLIFKGTETDQPNLRASVIEPSDVSLHTDFPGNDIRSVRTSNAEHCRVACLREGRCRAYTFVTAHRRCWLKHGVGATRRRTNMISGRKSFQSFTPQRVINLN